MPKGFVQAWNAKDPDLLASLFEEEAEFVNVVGLWWHDREAIRKAHAYGLARIFPDSSLSIRKLKVKYLSETIALVHARMLLTGQSPIDGIQPGDRQTVFSFVVRKGPDGWRCASAHNTDIVPGRETHVRNEQGRLAAVDDRKGSSNADP